MKKKILYTLYSAVFIGACLIPAVMTPFADSGETLENRTLADKPSVKNDDGSLNLDFFSDFDTYFSEHFAFRQKLVTADGKIRSEIFNTSSDDDVIVGKDDWLYYEPTSDDFMNVNVLSDRAINNINHNLELLSDYCRQQGADFIFTIAPNKNSIYPEYMPYNYVETDNSGNYEKFTEAYSEIENSYMQAIASSDSNTVIPSYFSFCDLKSTLLAEKQNSSYPLYHKTDTHWNNIGALTARNSLLSVSDEDNIFSGTNWSVVCDWSGDLAEMLYPSDVPMDNQYYSDYDFTYSYVGVFHSFDDITIKTTCEGAEGKLLMYRDSFGEAILPFIAESFAEAEFSRSVPYNTGSITEGTTVILEIVERNMGNLQKYAPVMPAPVYSEDFPSAEKTGSITTLKIEQSGSYAHIYGELGEDFFSGDDAEILVTVGGVTYEAFNCFEDKLLEREGETSDNGFSLYITMNDGDALPQSEDVQITVLSNNAAVSSK